MIAARSSSRAMRDGSRWRCLLHFPALLLQSLSPEQGWPQRPSRVNGAQRRNLPLASKTYTASVCPSLASMALSLGGRGFSAVREARSKAASSARVTRRLSVVVAVGLAAALFVATVVGLFVATVVGLVELLVVEQVALCSSMSSEGKPPSEVAGPAELVLMPELPNACF